MRLCIILLCLVWPGFKSNTAFAVLQVPPWAPDARCVLNPARPQGLHPDAESALRKQAIAHRITQGINHSLNRGNVHDTDVTIKGIAYTAAADISVRCLTSSQIQALLGTLAVSGFAGWYRKDGEDGWKGPPHIHAIYVGSTLKPVLKRQVESWLNGRNGLGSDQLYKFWQASPEMRHQVRALYNKFN